MRSAIGVSVLAVLGACGGRDRPETESPALTVVDGAKSDAEAKIALVYRDLRSCDDCSNAVADVLRNSRYRFRVEFVGPGEVQDIRDDLLAKATLYAQPGGLGTVEAEFAHVAPHAQQIRQFVADGGRYLGFCMGGYLAGKAPGFDLLPVDTDAYINSPGASVHDQRDTLVDVIWRGGRRTVYFQDGPFFTPPASPPLLPAVVPFAHYQSNGTVAALVAPFGRGRVGVVGFHPEAPHAWYADKGLSDKAGLANDMAAELVDAVMR